MQTTTRAARPGAKRKRPDRRPKKQAQPKKAGPQTAQQTIPYREIFKDGICRVNDKLYTKSMEYEDINYQLAQADDQSAIFDGYCAFLNSFDSSLPFQLSFINHRSRPESKYKLNIPTKNDEYSEMRSEYVEMLEGQIAKRVTDAYYSRCLKGFHMSGQAPYGFELEPTVVEGIRTKMMAADPVAANHVRLMFEMYAEPETSFGDITRYFEEQGIKIYGKSLTRPFLSQLLRNPVYAQADLEMYEFFKSQGAVVANDAADFAGTNGCYLYQGRDVKEDKDKSLKDQILVIAPHEGFVPSDIWLRCRKKLMTNITFQNGRKARNTWLAGKIKCGKCGYALKTTHNPSGYEYLRCSKRADHKGCPGCGTLRKNEFEQFIFTAMGEKFREFKLLRGGEEKANPKITAYQVELAQVEAEIEKLLDTLTGANATLLAYANKKIEDLDNRRKTLSKAIADLSVETLSSQQIELLSGYLDDWENISFEDKRKAADGLISSISATSDYVKIEWKI